VRKKRKGQAAALQAANKYAKALHNAAHVPRPQPATPPRLLTKAQVLALVPVTFPTIWAWMRAGKFPRAKIIGTRSVWVEAEIYAWIAARPQRPLKGD
jgi:predicted DNA-binding transcriptional regulator AlpA